MTIPNLSGGLLCALAWWGSLAAGAALAQSSTPAPAPVEEPAGASPSASAAAQDAGVAEPAGAAKMEISEVPLDQMLEIVSASQQVEPLREVPGPATVITAEMLRSSGVRTLEEALNLFVPGFTPVMDHNERQLAMRGVYASAQQKILIMIDGHRLNSRAYSQAAPGFSIALDSLRQIEVLRGPGSAVYGNAALTAVVNLVTKTGSEVRGADLRAGLGNYGQQFGSAVLGQDFGAKGDALAWGQYFYASGEAVPISAAQSFSAVPKDGSILVGAVRDPANYDVGLRYRLGPLTAFVSRRLDKVVEPYTSSGPTGELYDYGAIRPFRGHGPGITSEWTHLGLTLDQALTDRLEVHVSGSFDTNEVGGVLVSSGDTHSAVYLSWVDDALGAEARAQYRYELGAFGHGNLTAGGQFERMRLVDSVLPQQVGGGWTKFGDTAERPVLERGHEESYSGYAQVKHRLLADKLIFNLGFRYDYKARHEGAGVSDFSPRVAVIYVPNDTFDAKLSYSQSFVDAPYWYRYNSLGSYQGSRGLTPEHLKSVQLTGSVSLLGGQLKDTVNVFYNDLTDFVFRDNAGCASATPVCYRNAGALTSVGVEDELSFVRKSYRLRANLTYQAALKQENVYVAQVTGGEIPNVPSLVANLVADVNPLAPLGYDALWLNLSARYTGGQLAPITSNFTASGGPSYVDLEHREPPSLVVNLGLHLTGLGLEGLSVDATLTNLFNQRYSQGGSMTHPSPQPGRWFLITLGYHLPV